MQWQTIRYIKNQTDEIFQYAINTDKRSLEFIKNKSEDYYFSIIKKFGWLNICKSAVQHNYTNMVYIKNPTDEFFKWAVMQNAMVLKFIPRKKITYELCKLALQKNYDVFKFIPINMKTVEICKILINIDNKKFKYISNRMKKNPELCKLAVELDSDNLQYIPEKKNL